MTTELAYTYNDFGLPVKLTYTDVDGETRTVREETNLTYDGNGNILTEAVTEAYSGSTTKTRTYQYDLGNRLISAAYDGTTTTYTYDAVGNRLTRQEGTETAETYTYNYLNQLTRVQQGTAVTTYAYDARGNQTQQVQTGTGVTTTTNYGYDLANRLISSSVTNNAVNPLSTSATYAYNAQGQRVTRVEDGVVTHFYYTGSALLFTTVNEYVLQTQNILDPSGTIVASKRFEGQAETGQDPYAEDYFFYRYDIRGSVTTIVDGEGAVVKSYDYDEFGVTTSTGDAFFNEVTFTGSIADASGLLYMNARYYNPATARFLSQDTYTGSASDPWTQHLYAYCNNNPVNMVDPTGHSALLIALLVAITTTVLVSTGCSPEEEVDVLSDRDYNCTGYAYRLTEHHTEKARRYLKPGEIGNVYFDPMRLRSMNGLDISSNIYETIKADMNAMGYYCADTFSLEFDLETGEMIPKTAPGNWIIAFAYDGRSENESDFHFWRWDGDHWSHKTGVQPASNTDFSGNALDHFYSLERADRGIYTSQLYYFEIGPSPIE